MVFGANIGTSVTNTIVAMTQMGDRNELRRAFAAGTVHDMFNWATVIIVLPIEVISTQICYVFIDINSHHICSLQLAFHPLENLAFSIVDVATGPDKSLKVDFLKVLTKPVTKLLVDVNSKAINSYFGDEPLCDGNQTSLPEQCNLLKSSNKTDAIFNQMYLGDTATGILLLFISLIILCGSLLLMVKTLNSLLKGAIARAIKKVLNPTFDSPVGNYFYGYFNVLVRMN